MPEEKTKSKIFTPGRIPYKEWISGMGLEAEKAQKEGKLQNITEPGFLVCFQALDYDFLDVETGEVFNVEAWIPPGTTAENSFVVVRLVEGIEKERLIAGKANRGA